MGSRVSKYAIILSGCFILIAIGWFGNILFASLTTSQQQRIPAIREDDPSYQYISPLILAGSTEKESPEYDSLKKQIASYIDSEKNNDNAISVSVYFRELNSGLWTAVNKDTLYDPSSMLKVAVMMGYLNAADTNPTILQKKFSYIESIDPGQYFKPKNPLKSGVYAAEDLIQAMIIDSDNTALEILYDNGREDFIDILKTLHIPPPASKITLDFMSPEIYSNLFRSLYNGTYLSKEASQKALKLLTQTTFKDGIVQGVPEGIPIAHKFGEHTTLNQHCCQ